MNIMRNTCRHLIDRHLFESNHPFKGDIKFVLKAERWMFKNLGCGHFSLTAFFNHLNEKRLEKRDIEFWADLRRQVFLRDNFTCVYCNQVGGILECDHIIPYSAGGSNNIENLATSCRKCNRQKKDKSVEEFLIWKQGRL